MDLRWVLALCVAVPGCAAAGGRTWSDREEFRTLGQDAGMPAEDPGMKGGEGDRPRTGGYGGVSLMNSIIQDERTVFGTGGSDLGFGVRFGYRLDPDYALELALDQNRGYVQTFGSARSGFNIESIAVQGKAYAGSGSAQPFALLGLGMSRASADGLDDLGQGLFFRGGLGIECNTSRNLALFMEGTYNVPTGDLRHLKHADFQGGILIRF